VSFAQPASGDLVGGRYRIVRELGRGAMGVVYEAEHEGLGRKCALKLLRPAQSSDEDAVRRFEREARILAKLDSPHLVEVLDVARTEHGVPYLVMELLEGESLESRLSRGELPPEEALAIVRDVAQGAHAAHVAGVVHRDLKLSNVVLTASGAKVVDFGVASFFDGSMDGSTASVAGTPRTMSPEQLLGEKVGPASDVWAIGVVTYRLFAGKYPFEAESMAAQMLAIMKGFVPLERACADARSNEIRDDDHAALLVRVARAVDAALVSDPTQRTSSALDFARALEEPAVEAVASSGRSSVEKAAGSDVVPTRESLAPTPEIDAKPSRGGLGAGAQAVLAALGLLVLVAIGMRIRESIRAAPPPPEAPLGVSSPSSASPVVTPSSSAPPPMPTAVSSASSSPAAPEPRPTVPGVDTSKIPRGPAPVPSARVAPKASAAPSGDGLPIHL
jgi:serine/threonine-protein kinase